MTQSRIKPATFQHVAQCQTVPPCAPFRRRLLHRLVCFSS